MKSIAETDQAQLETWNSKGVGMFKHTFRENELLYVPQGWIAAEQSEPKQRLFYGIRKSFMTHGTLSINAYASCIELFEASAQAAPCLSSLTSTCTFCHANTHMPHDVSYAVECKHIMVMYLLI